MWLLVLCRCHFTLTTKILIMMLAYYASKLSLGLIAAFPPIIALPPFDIRMGKLESPSRFPSFCPHGIGFLLQF